LFVEAAFSAKILRCSPTSLATTRTLANRQDAAQAAKLIVTIARQPAGLIRSSNPRWKHCLLR
jgi:hypothetical protein